MISRDGAGAAAQRGVQGLARPRAAETNADAGASLGGRAFPHADTDQRRHAHDAHQSSHAAYGHVGQFPKATDHCPTVSNLASTALGGAREGESATAGEFPVFVRALFALEHSLNSW